MRWGVCAPKLNQKWAPVCPESGRRLADCCRPCCRPRAAAHAAVHAPAQTPGHAPVSLRHRTLPDSPQEGAAAPGRLKGVGKAPPHPKAAMVPTPFLLIDKMHVFLVCAGGVRSERKGPGASQAWNVRSWVCAGYAPPTDARQGSKTQNLGPTRKQRWCPPPFISKGMRWGYALRTGQ